MTKVSLRADKIWVDGKPQLILAGEIHYFRLPQSEWSWRIDEAKRAGLNAIASYIPWLCHEEVEGCFDFESEHYALGHFIELCAEHGLWFIPRPGPFIMAEMKNEGIPYWVTKKYPELVPVGFHGKEATTADLDVMNPHFLDLAAHWLEAVVEVLRPHLKHVLALQLDNEIGMLSWVSNTPVLTEAALADFRAAAYKSSKLTVAQIREPEEGQAAQLRLDLGHFFRARTAAYVNFLQETLERLGIRDRPFIVNVHGTSDGRGLTYPIGISQLAEAYRQSSQLLPGSDYYFGDLDMNVFQDLYICNEMMKASRRKGQPVSAMEFNCGDGNFADDLSGRLDVSAVDLKTRLTLAQGNRLINYYLFSGGFNYEIKTAQDGNGRFAVTGERHGFAAPLNPEGEKNYTYDRLAKVIQTAQANADFLARAEAEYDDLSLAFIPEYFMTECVDPESPKMNEIVKSLETFRAGAAWENLARCLLLLGYRFDAVDIERQPIKRGALILPVAEYLSASLQRKLVRFIKSGGKLILYGELPQYDETGAPCRLLIDALGLEPGEKREDGEFGSLSNVPVGDFSRFAEVRTQFAQTFQGGESFLVEKASGLATAAFVGNSAIMTTTYSSHLDFFQQLMDRLGVEHALSHDCREQGILMLTQRSGTARLVHLLNLDGFDKKFRVFENGKPLFEGNFVYLGARRGLMLPINQGEVHWATGEITERGVYSSSGDYIWYETDYESMTFAELANGRAVT